MVNEEDKAAKTQAPAAEPKKPPPTQEELVAALEGLVNEAIASGKRDDPAIARVRDMLDRREGGKDASKKG